MSKYQPYPQYKDSGIDWLGEVPEHWTMTKLKFVGEAIIGLTYSPSEITDEHNGILVLRSSNVQNKKITFDDNVYVNSKIPKHLLTQKGDILICSRNGSRTLIGKNALVDENSENLTFGAFMTIFRTTYYRYIFWVLNSSIFEFQSATFLTATINQLTTTNLNNFDVPFPSHYEQQAIANFLDNATCKIDTLIQKQQNLIELLKEKRQALISHAVTKGLNPHVKMKDSGIEWLGEVPEHWEKGLLSNLFTNNKEKNSGMLNNNLLSLSYGKIVNKDIETSFGLLPESFESYQIVHDGYVVLRLTDLQNDQKSLRTGFVTQTGIITSAYVALKKKSKSIGNERYFHLYLHSFDIFKGFYGMGSGVRQSLNYDELKKLQFVLPPIEEQNEIVNFLDNATCKIDTLITKAQKAIELLKERRTALISATVTGKIDVRNVHE